MNLPLVSLNEDFAKLACGWMFWSFEVNERTVSFHHIFLVSILLNKKIGKLMSILSYQQTTTVAFTFSRYEIPQHPYKAEHDEATLP